MAVGDPCGAPCRLGCRQRGRPSCPGDHLAGSAAAIAINADLVQEDVERAVFDQRSGTLARATAEGSPIRERPFHTSHRADRE